MSPFQDVHVFEPRDYTTGSLKFSVARSKTKIGGKCQWNANRREKVQQDEKDTDTVPPGI